MDRAARIVESDAGGQQLSARTSESSFHRALLSLTDVYAPEDGGICDIGVNENRMVITKVG